LTFNNQALSEWEAKKKEASIKASNRLVEILDEFGCTLTDYNSGDPKTKKRVAAILAPFQDELDSMQFNEFRPSSEGIRFQKQDEISLSVMNRAQKLTDYYLAQYRLLQCEYRTKYLDNPEDLGLKLLRYARSYSEQELTAREAIRRFPHNKLTAGQVRETFELIAKTLPSEFITNAKGNLVKQGSSKAEPEVVPIGRNKKKVTA